MTKQETVSLAHLLTVCIEAGRLACERIRQIHASGKLLPVEKGNGKDSITGRPMTDIQTEADRQSEQVIFTTLLRFFPNLRIIGEEESSGFQTTPQDGADDQTSAGPLPLIAEVAANIPASREVLISDLIVFVDPLDGTGEFVSGRLQCVSAIIGISMKGRPLAGVIYRPFPCPQYPETCLYGAVGVGSFLDHRPMPVTRGDVSNTVAKITTTLKKSHRVIDRFFQLAQPCEIMRDGGAGWKCWLVATGQADCYQYARPGTKKWDILAGDAIVTAMGGVVTDACGRLLNYTGDLAKLNNEWGIMVSMDIKWHFDKCIVASHTALVEAAQDPEFTQWPSGLEIPPLFRVGDSSL